MTLGFHGGAGTVTGSCFLVETDYTRFLVDCGLFQGCREVKERNYMPFPFNPRDIQFLLLTHAHIDHSGLIPKLVKAGFTGPVFTTEGTRDLAEIMLPDSGHIQEMEVERKNRKGTRAGREPLVPIYTVEDAHASLSHFSTVTYGEVIAPTNGVRVRFIDAGHILGSSSIEVWLGEDNPTKIVFSGDIGPGQRPIIDDPDAVCAADYVLVESTYGDRLRPPDLDPARQLKEVVEETMSKGGNLVIPAFAVERTQDILYTIQKMQLAGEFPGGTVYLDSPMAQAATDVFCNHYEYYDQETKDLADLLGKCPLHISGLVYSRSAEESMEINNVRSGAIIISASGMCDAGRVKHHLKHNLWRPECTVLLVGYQARGTLGRQLLEGAKRVRIHGEEVAVRASIRSLEGFTAHADQSGLIAWLRCFQARPSTVFVTHGENDSSLTLAQLIQKELGLDAVVPQADDVVELEGGKTSLQRRAGNAREMEEQCVVDMEREYINLGDDLRGLLSEKHGARRARQRILPLLDGLRKAISEEMAVDKR